MFFDSPVTHAFTFTPAISLFVNCDSEEEITFLYEKLSEKGTVMMEFNTYPFAKKFAWLADKYGVSWQLSLK
jgi:predicted 3-demethylubiquinone-9 3-methyltransferase (glyoxalase superfamily)